jgi:hypothetical protein
VGKKPWRGYYCWVCGRARPNERFSRKGRARHLCRECAKLGSAELALRQHERNIDRLVGWGGTIPRKHRPGFDRYLAHESERIRAYAARVLAEHDAEIARLRAERAAARAEEEAFEERCMAELEAFERGAPVPATPDRGHGDVDDIPF